MTALTQIPAEITAGDSLTVDLAALRGEYPPPAWTLTFALTPKEGGPVTTIPAADSGDSWRVAMTPAETSSLPTGRYAWALALPTGRYAWALVAEDTGAGERRTVQRGELAVVADPLTSTGDTRSDAERILAAIEATIEGRATKDAESYSIEGRSISRTPIEQLLRLRAVYQRSVDAEAGISPIRQRRVRFS